MIYTTHPSFDPYPPYCLQDRLDSLTPIYDIFCDIPRNLRLEQITHRYELIRDNVLDFKIENQDLYYNIITEMEFAALKMALIDMCNKVKTCDMVKTILRTIVRRYDMSANNEVPTIITIALLKNPRIPKMVSFEHIDFIEAYDLMDLTKYSQTMDEFVSEYRQYKISKIVS